MPTYDYRCTGCKHAFEQFQSMKDASLRKCPRCGKNTLERLIGTGAAVLFKGSGFYQTDYRSEGYKKSAEAEKPAAPATATTPTTPAGADAKSQTPSTAGASDPKPSAPKSESKPETKAAPPPSGHKSGKRKRD